jgi:hypothetical protein
MFLHVQSPTVGRHRLPVLGQLSSTSKVESEMKYQEISDQEDREAERAATWNQHHSGRHHHLILYTLLSLLVLLNLILLTTLHNLGLHFPLGSLSSSVSFPNKTIFRQHEEYESFAKDTDYLWSNLQSPNGGFMVKEINGDKHNFGISMFHQLHCLQNLREAIQLFSLTLNGTISLDKTKERADFMHFGHCVDYLRQV